MSPAIHKNAPPPVSVCLTTYNRGSVLAATLDSVVSQEMADFELIISDDNSTDNTADISLEFAARDNRIRYRCNAVNLKMPGNLNAAIRSARAPLVANLHDGDVYRTDLLKLWRQAMDEQPDAAFVWNQLESVDAHGCHVGLHVHPFGSRIEPLELTRYMLGRLDSPVWGTVMARRACYESDGLFDSRFGFISDVEMWMRLNLRHPVAYVAEPLIKITPREAHHPYAFINWDLEQTLIEIHRSIIDRIHASPAQVRERRTALRSLGRLQVRRWLWLAAVSVSKRRPDLYRQALALFRQQEQLILKSVGLCGVPLGFFIGKHRRWGETARMRS